MPLPLQPSLERSAYPGVAMSVPAWVCSTHPTPRPDLSAQPGTYIVKFRSRRGGGRRSVGSDNIESRNHFFHGCFEGLSYSLAASIKEVSQSQFNRMPAEVKHEIRPVDTLKRKPLIVSNPNGGHPIWRGEEGFVEDAPKFCVLLRDHDPMNTCDANISLAVLSYELFCLADGFSHGDGADPNPKQVGAGFQRLLNERLRSFWNIRLLPSDSWRQSENTLCGSGSEMQARCLDSEWRNCSGSTIAVPQSRCSQVAFFLRKCHLARYGEGHVNCGIVLEVHTAQLSAKFGEFPIRSSGHTARGVIDQAAFLQHFRCAGDPSRGIRGSLQVATARSLCRQPKSR